MRLTYCSGVGRKGANHTRPITFDKLLFFRFSSIKFFSPFVLNKVNAVRALAVLTSGFGMTVDSLLAEAEESEQQSSYYFVKIRAPPCLVTFYGFGCPAAAGKGGKVPLKKSGVV